MFKKFIAYLLTVSVLLSMLVVNVSAADEGISAERVEKFENAVTLLTKIGAIAEDDALNFDSGISKGKFVDIMSKIVPVSGGSLVPAFQDVPATHEYFKVIQGFADAGYINGNGGSFEPDRDITYNEALYIAMNTMGYKDFMAVVGAFPTGGWKIAEQLDIKMKNKGAVAGDILYMLYQALTTDMLKITGMKQDAFIFSNEQSESILEKYLEVTDTKGVLQSNGQVSLIGGYEAEDNVIVVDGFYYRLDEPCDILAGCTVDLFYDMDTNAPVCVLAAAENQIIEIDSADLEGYMNNKYSYKVDGVKKTVKINDQADIVKNNVLVDSVPNDLFMEPVNGKVVIVDNGKGSGYDVVYIKDYISFVARSVESDTKSATIKAEARYGLPSVIANFENNAPAVYDAEGNRLSVEDIAIGSVISVMGNVVSGNLIPEEIVISKDIVTGALTSVYSGNEAYLVIDDVKYPVADSIATAFLSTITPQIDMTFFVDFMGNIVALDDSISGSMAYGYVLDAYMGTNDDGDECIIAKVFSEIGSIIKYKVSNKRLTVDGVTSVKNYADAMRDEYLRMFRANIGKLIRYDVNNDRELSKVDFCKQITDTTGPAPTVDDRLYRSLDNSTGADSTITQFYGSKKAFGDKVHVDEDTIFFKLPDVDADADETEYKVIRKFSGLKDGRYGITAYKLGTDMMYAKVVVLRELLRPSLSQDHIGNMMVTKVTQVLNEYNEPTYSITLLGTSGEKTYLTKNERVAKFPITLTNEPTAKNANTGEAVERLIVPGDIVRCFLTEDESTIAQIAVCYDIRKAGLTDMSSSTTNWVSDNGTFGVGYVYALDDKRIGIASGEVPAVGTVLEDNQYSTYMVDTFKIYKVTTTGVGLNRIAKDISPATKADLKSFKTSGTNCSNVLALSSRGTGQILYIFE